MLCISSTLFSKNSDLAHLIDLSNIIEEVKGESWIKRDLFPLIQNILSINSRFRYENNLFYFTWFIIQLFTDEEKLNVSKFKF